MAELSVFDQAIEQYPILKGLGLTSKVSPATDNNKLEFWPPGEPGAEGRLRPREFPIDKPGVELYGDRATPLDVLGDVTSHHLITADPKIADYYRRFTESLTPEQKNRLKEQHQYALKNSSEVRPLEEWQATAGLPAYFRGYAFKQWPDEFNAKAYTPEQRRMFDDMMARGRP